MKGGGAHRGSVESRSESTESCLGRMGLGCWCLLACPCWSGFALSWSPRDGDHLLMIGFVGVVSFFWCGGFFFSFFWGGTFIFAVYGLVLFEMGVSCRLASDSLCTQKWSLSPVLLIAASQVLGYKCPGSPWEASGIHKIHT